MNSLQIFVKLSPFITAHNSNILSHTTVYSLYPHNLKIVHWPPLLAGAGRKATQVLFILIQGCMCRE